MNCNFSNPNAVAHIQGSKEFSNICGQIAFYQRQNYVLVEATIKHLPAVETGFFGFHIHEGDSCTGNDFSYTGSHYNPTNTQHPTHAGDLPTLMLCNGGAYLVVSTDRFSVRDIIGRTVVIHQMPDDFKSQPAGHAGTKIACGKICRV